MIIPEREPGRGAGATRVFPFRLRGQAVNVSSRHAAGGLFLFACLASQLGPAVVVVAMALGGFAMFAALNYWLWGHKLTEQADDPSEPEA